MVSKKELKLEDIELSKVSFNSKYNLTELLNETFLKELTDKFGNVECINFVINISPKDESQIPNLIMLSHKNDEDIKNKKISAELNTIKYSNNNNNNNLKDVVELLIK